MVLIRSLTSSLSALSKPIGSVKQQGIVFHSTKRSSLLSSHLLRAMSDSAPLARVDPSPETLSHFSSPAWAQAYFNNPLYTPITNTSRIPRPAPSTLETFLSTTLNSPTTIIAWQNFHSPPSHQYKFGSLTALVKLGTGLNGHEGIAHGGFVTVLLDEIIGMACDYREDGRVPSFTVYLNSTFKKPVRTPGVLLLRGWVERREGRKIWAKGVVEGPEGEVLTEGEALFIVPKEVLDALSVGIEKL